MSDRELFERYRLTVQKFGGTDEIYKGHQRFKNFTAEDFVKKCGLTPAEAERALQMMSEILEFFSEREDYLRDMWAERAQETAANLRKV